MGRNSCTSLVSAITLDEEAFKGSACGGSTSLFSREDTANASFDIKPLPPVRGPSFSFPLAPSSGHSEEGVQLTSSHRVSRFDLVCRSQAHQSPLRALQRLNTDRDDLRSAKSNAPNTGETKLSTTLPISYQTTNPLRGQLQSMLPLSKPMRRDVSGATLSIVDRTNICSMSPHENTAIHNASSWASPHEERISNYFSTHPFGSQLSHSTSMKLKASLLPISKPVRQKSANMDGSDYVQNLKQQLQSHEAASQMSNKMHNEKDEIQVFASPGSSCSSDPFIQLHSSFPRPLVHSPYTRTLRYGLRRSSRCNAQASEDPMENESSAETHSGHKRSNMKSYCSTNSLCESSPDDQEMKRFRRHSSPWYASSPNAGAENLHSSPKRFVLLQELPLSREVSNTRLNATQRQLLPPAVEEAPLEPRLNDSLRDPLFNSLTKQELDGVCPDTPKSLQRNNLMRFSNSNHDDDRRPMMIQPRRQNSDKFCLCDDDDMDSQTDTVEFPHDVPVFVSPSTHI